MKRRAAVLLVAAVLAAIAPICGSAARTPAFVLVELFTSERCSSCPPADTFLQRLIDRPPSADVQVVGLGHQVDYWNRGVRRGAFIASRLGHVGCLTSVTTAPMKCTMQDDESTGS